MKQRTGNKNEAEKIKCDNFAGNNREKCNIAIMILGKWLIGTNHLIYFSFLAHQYYFY